MSGSRKGPAVIAAPRKDACNKPHVRNAQKWFGIQQYHIGSKQRGACEAPPYGTDNPQLRNHDRAAFGQLADIGVAPIPSIRQPKSIGFSAFRSR
ncbi:MAG: hypothetical protein U0S50_03690 [Sphingopyxis sp.]|uniref:hypothetical protein n=1 Tax=Sphingopyxis sp. TaxID=1908224 RepID=UPI002ABBF437|nr:hypothetical protein [Sphingopyxis sp.]MDZ3830906.1 hypothetical protein [Sphingopyxis sp.]